MRRMVTHYMGGSERPPSPPNARDAPAEPWRRSSCSGRPRRSGGAPRFARDGRGEAVAPLDLLGTAAAKRWRPSICSGRPRRSGGAPRFARDGRGEAVAPLDEDERVTTTDLCFTSAVELAALIRRRALSPVEIMRAVLE